MPMPACSMAMLVCYRGQSRFVPAIAGGIVALKHCPAVYPIPVIGRLVYMIGLGACHTCTPLAEAGVEA